MVKGKVVVVVAAAVGIVPFSVSLTNWLMKAIVDELWGEIIVLGEQSVILRKFRLLSSLFVLLNCSLGRFAASVELKLGPKLLPMSPVPGPLSVASPPLSLILLVCSFDCLFATLNLSKDTELKFNLLTYCMAQSNTVGSVSVRLSLFLFLFL